MKNFFTEIQNRLISLSPQKPQGHALKRLNNLSGLVSGMIRKGSSHLPDIGSGIRKNIDAHSKTTAAKRFVENKNRVDPHLGTDIGVLDERCEEMCCIFLLL